MARATTQEPEILGTGDPAWSLDRDLKKAAADLGDAEVRYLVDSYYDAQDFRKQQNQRVAASQESGEPSLVMQRLAGDAARMEGNIKYALDKWGQSDPGCQWARSITGIGPVIAAGLAAHIDMEHCPTVGHIWSFAGLNPESKWEKGQKRPWNASLKTLCWKIGESFVKVSGRESDVYGKVYLARKEYETQLNEQGAFAAQAADILKRVPNHKQKAIYAQGKLPDGHIHSRAKRYAVKLFLAHWHYVMYQLTYGTPPPFPYIFSEAAKIAGHGNHLHFTVPPGFEDIEVPEGMIKVAPEDHNKHKQ